MPRLNIPNLHVVFFPDNDLEKCKLIPFTCLRCLDCIPLYMSDHL